VRTAGGKWRRLRRKPVNADGTFATWPRYLRSVRAARAGKVRPYKLRNLHLSRRARVIRIRAVVTGAGRSNVVRVRLRHPAPKPKPLRKRAHRRAEVQRYA
jgi:hypothetical protein